MDRLETTNILLSIIVIFILGLVLKLAQPIAVTIFISVLLAYMMDTLVALFQKIGLHLFLAVPVAALIFLGLFTGIAIIVYNHLLAFAHEFPDYQAKLMSIITDILARLQFSGAEVIKEYFLGELRNLPVGSIALSAVSSVANLITNFFLVYLFAILALLGKYSLIRKIRHSFTRESSHRIAFFLKHIDSALRNYIGIKTAMGLTIGITSGIALSLFQVKYSIIFGFLAFLFNFIPYLGSTIAVVLPVLSALIQFEVLTKPLWILIVLIILQTLVGALLKRKIVGQQLNLSITVVFFSLLFWGWLWGAPGVLLAVPMTTSIKIVMENIPWSEPIALMLETTKPKKKN